MIKNLKLSFYGIIMLGLVASSVGQTTAQGNIANGDYHTAVILSDGTVKTWGSNLSGQLGLGDALNKGDGAGEMGDNLSIVDLGTGRTAVRVAAGANHTVVILDDGSVKAWGNNTYGQLGQGHTNNIGDGAGEMGDNLSAVDLGTGRTAVAIAAGDNHTAVILDDGTIKVWGQNAFGQLGQGNTIQLGDDSGEMGSNLSTVNLGTGRTAVYLAAGGGNTAVILDDGTVKVWGKNTFGQLGQGHINSIGDDSNEMGDNLLAVNLGTSITAIDIAVGTNHIIAILNDSTLKAWGYNNRGQLGYGHINNLGDGAGEMGDALPTLANNIKALAVAAGANHSLAILHDGTVTGIGWNNYGQLGFGHTNDIGNDASDQMGFVELGTGRTATAISAGYLHSSVILDLCGTKAWGLNNAGQLGQSNTANIGDGANEMGDNLSAIDLGTGKCPATKLTPISSGPSITFDPDNSTTNVAPTTNVIIHFNEAIRNLDDSGITDTNVDALITLKETDATGTHIVFDATINAAKTAIIINPVVNFATSQAIYVAIGATVEDLQNNPILAKSSTFTTGTLIPGQLNNQISSGYYTTNVILTDGSVKGWGSNVFGATGQGHNNTIGNGAGQMGDNLSTVDLGSGRTAAAVAVGNSTAAILDNGQLKAWGKNTFGQLGQGHTNHLGDGSGEMGDNLSAVDLGSGRTAVAVAVSLFHTAVILDNGNVKAWGRNSYGQLGQGHKNNLGDGSGEMGDNLSAVNLGTGRTAIAIAAGSNSTGVILDNGQVKIWGLNQYGELGQGHNNRLGDGPGEMGDNLAAVDLGAGRTAIAITAGEYHYAVILDDGTVKTWGRGNYGQLGQEHNSNIGDASNEMGSYLPSVNIGTGRTAIAIDAGYNHTTVIMDNGKVKTWGLNDRGQLGQGNTNNIGDNAGEMGDALSAIDLGTGRVVLGISGGSDYTSVILDDCTVKAFGFNLAGELGIGNNTTIGDGSGEMGNNLASVDLGTGICAATTALSITIDNTPPTVTFSPVNGATSVSLSANVLISFNEAIRNTDNSVLTDSNVDGLITLKLDNSSGADIGFDATINSAKTLITVTPSSNFSSSQTIYVAIGSTVEDGADNAISAANASFATLDAVGPTISWVPTDGSINVAVSSDVTLTFNESVRNTDDSGLTDINVDALITLKNTDASGSDIPFDATVSGGGSALSFDGINDYVEISDPSDGSLDFGTGDYAFSVWFNTNALGTTQQILCKREIGNYEVQISPNGYLSSWIGVDGFSSNAQVSPNVWNNVIITRSGSSVSMYLNGALVGTVTSSASTSSDRNFIIGNDGYGLSEYFYGLIDEISVWNSALTSNEVISLYNSGSPILSTSNSGNYLSSGSLVGYWGFNEGSGSTVADGSSIGNNGTISGASWTTISPGGNTVITINPVSNFSSNQTVYAAIGTEVEDFSDNANSASNTTFTTADIIAPTITFSPSDGTQGVAINNNVTITFSEAVRLIDDSGISDTNIDALITLKDTDGNGSDISFDATINTAKTVITIDPVSNFSSVQTVYVSIGSTVEDVSHNAISGGNASFVTIDTQGPSYIWNPVNGATGVSPASNVRLTFAEMVRNIDDTDLTDTNVDALLTLKDSDINGSDISFDATVSSAGGVGSLYFDGNDDYVIVERQIQDDFTIQAWVKTTTSRTGSRFYQGLGIVYADVAGWGMDFGTSILNGKFSFGTGTSDKTILSTSSIDDGNWHHVVATREKATGTISVYVNGALENSLVTTNTMALSSPTQINIGANTIDSRYFKGNIREVAVWNSTVSSAGVAALYNSGSPLNTLADAGNYTSSGNIMGYWKLNDGSGSVADDGSASANDGTINGAVWNSDGGGGYTIITMNPTGDFTSSQVVYAAIGSSVEDVSDNAISASSTTFTIANVDAPRIVSGSLANDNSYVLISISEAVYNTNGNSGALEVSDFNMVFNQNNGTATAVSVTGISKSDGTALAGGETIIRLNLSITGTPNGVETVAFKPTNGSSIFDIAALAMGTAQTTGPLPLNDLAPPIMVFSPGKDATGVGIGSNVTIAFSEPVRHTDNSAITNDNIDALLTLKNTNISGDNIPFEATVSLNKKIISINPTNYFQSLQTVYVAIGSTLEDSLDNATPDSSITFIVADVDPPTVVFNPAHGDTGVAYNSNITLTFSEPIRLKNNQVLVDAALDTIIDLRDTDSTGSVLGFTASINSSKTIITVNPVDYFRHQQNIYVGIGETVEDTVGNLISPAFAVFTSQSDQFPLVAFNPANSDVNVGVESNITITFTEPVRLLNNDRISNVSVDDLITLKDTNGDGKDLLFDAVISEEMVMITIDPYVDFTSQQSIYVGLGAGTEDSLNNIVGAHSVIFTAKDTQRPFAIFDPQDKSVDVPRNKSVIITFNEPIRKISNLQFTDSSIDDVVVLKKGNADGEDLSFDATINETMTVITVDPGNDFDYQQAIYAAITSEIEDTSDNVGYVGSSIFTTTDDTLKGPSIVSLIPPDNSIDVTGDQNLIIKFDENIITNPGYFIIYEYTADNEFEKIEIDDSKITISGNSLIVNPDGLFNSLSSYYVIVGNAVVTDSRGNLSTGILDKDTWNFTIRDMTLPMVAITPADSSTDVAVDTNIVLTFSEPIFHLDGSRPTLASIRSNIVFQTNNPNRTRFNVAYDLTNSTDGLVYTIDPKVYLYYAEDYIVSVKNLRDETGNILLPASSAFTTVYGQIQTYITTIANPTNSRAIPIEVSFGTSVTDFTLSDIEISGGTGQSFSGGNKNYFFEVVPSAEGDITINIPKNVCHNVANVNDVNVAAALIVTYDGLAPSIKYVVDGTKDGITDMDYQSSKNMYIGSWTLNEDLDNISQIKAALGTYPGGSNTVNWRYLGLQDTIQYNPLSLIEGRTYYLSISAEDKVGNTSEIVVSDGIIIDGMKPEVGIVNDGLGEDVDYVESNLSVAGNWHGFIDRLGVVSSYNIALGSKDYSTDLMDWVNTGNIDSTFSKTITLPLYEEIFFLVQAVDQAGNESSVKSSDGFIVDPHLGKPTIVSVTPQEGSILNMSNVNTSKISQIKFEFSEPVKSYSVDSKSFHTTGFNYALDSMATELTITIDPPLVSLDTIEITITNMVDSAGRAADDYIINYYTPPLGDYNMDMKINVLDLNQLVSGWKSNDSEFELGPTQGLYPHMVIDGNSDYDLDDAMVFGRFWGWSVAHHGLAKLFRLNTAEKPVISMRMNGFEIQPPIGAKTAQLFFEYDSENVTLNFSNANATNDSEIILSRNEQKSGQAIYEIGSLKQFDLKPIRVDMGQVENNESPVILSYVFYSAGQNVISEGEQEVNLVQVPESFSLSQNYPNPFNPITQIQYQLPYQTKVNLTVYDVLGNEVVVLVKKNQAPGTYKTIWNGLDKNGRQLSGGVYFYRLKTKEFSKTKKLVLLK
ncbi:MAG: T9SS type A sorting domain-containing protein [Candidatus Marinimicrobia bacterium]|jgi:alpha-tubulin suppressor-like RCC1 family protein|nr:T9SS type A sorting domain-containing protein [Candidatus Neomarinimicrobiota bacterium]MBT4271080.1 T9SS type A sorting domain-containing protein [Candidatus Neomarinimicrobiota bacterium]MBT6841436.1 T9SS type A sorting domain-containing protein [Candidatus Neomarinimicrobiota bacterium]MBT7496618.1 T9SS type A sorting domain-containing protein [Candidatus Neomarinimicrobiota bacterium]